MGATKRLCEMMITTNGFQVSSSRFQVGGEPETRNPKPETLFTAVRFGNVLGSRGSVVPTFRKQIEMGGAVTVTNSEATRYFMSLREAVSLIIQAASLTQGGDIFMLEMGEEIKIEDLARKMIRLRGLRVGADVEIKHVGLRPGEKLHERLIAADEEKHPTTCPHIFRVQNNRPIDRGWLLSQIEELMSLVEERENDRLVSKLWEIAGAGEEGSGGDEVRG